MDSKKKHAKQLLLLLVAIMLLLPQAVFGQESSSGLGEQEEKESPVFFDSRKEIRIIRKIIIEGNKHIGKDAISNKLPYKISEPFDLDLSADAIRHIYTLGFFKQIKIETEEIGTSQIDVYVTLEENPLLERTEFHGNKAIKSKKFIERLNLDKVETFSEEQLERAIEIIKTMYRDEGYLFAKVTGKIVPDKDIPDKIVANFQIEEGIKSKVLRIDFIGNKNIPDRKLRQIILTRENWILSILTNAGKYHPEMVEMDKKLIERYYQDNGYLLAKVTDAKVEFSENKKDITISFDIEEGNQFTVKNLAAPGDDIFIESDLLPHILLETNKPYNASKVAQTIERLKELWGEKGYVNVDVYPQITPNEDTNEVDITFFAERGNKINLNRVEITGNEITNDKIIRRSIDLEEGEMITTKKLDDSLDDVERLGFFEKGGVNWKMHRINDELVDLEMNVKEAKTGHAGFNMSLGSESHSNKRALRVGVTLEKQNFMGEGLDVGLQTQIQLAKKGSQLFEGHFGNPYLFDTDVSGLFSIYHRKQEFDEWINVETTPNIRETGGSARFGFLLPKIDKHMHLETEVGLEHIKTKNLTAKGRTLLEKRALQTIINNSFRKNLIQWLGLNFITDTRNHAIYPNRRFKIAFNNKLALPGVNKHYAFFKSELETSYYTSLIDEDKLVLALFGKVGTVFPLGRGKNIPYKELFHMGGQTTVRGFRFGSIGPAWKNQDPLGAKNAILFKTELIFPLVIDYSMKGHVFYDAGAGWGTPKCATSKPGLITRNTFDLRQSVGFGLNILYPQPIKIDWGYKLDRNKAAGESPHEFHLSANFAF